MANTETLLYSHYISSNKSNSEKEKTGKKKKDHKEA